MLALAAVSRSAESPGPALREPTYASGEPGYLVVAFGREEQCRVWLVLDGERLFVDRNGNADLTEPGERIAKDDQDRFMTTVSACDADGVRGEFRLSVICERDADGVVAVKYLSVNPVEDIQRFHCTTPFIGPGRRPEEAPTVPIDGPLRFVLMDHWTGATTCRTLPREGGEHEFSLLIASPVRGTAREAYVYPNLYPLVGERLPEVGCEIDLRDPEGAVATPEVSIRLCDCARRYRCKVTVPPAGKAAGGRLRVSFPGWTYGTLAPAVFDLP